MKTGLGTDWRLMAVALVLGAGQDALGQEVEPWATLKGHTYTVNSLMFSPDGRTLASASADGTVRLWEVLSGRERVAFKGHESGVNCVAFSPDGKRIASGSDDQTVRMWDASGKARCVSQDFGGPVRTLAFSPGGGRLAVGGVTWKESVARREGRLTLCAVRGGTLGDPLPLRGHTSVVLSVAFSPDGRAVVSSELAGGLVLREVASGKPRVTFKGYVGRVYAVTFLDGGQAVASGGSDKTIRVWDVWSGKQRAALKGHTASVSHLAASGRLLASGGQDGTVRLWDTATGKQLLVLRLNVQVWSVAFSPDGRTLAAGDWGGIIRLWSVPKLLAHKGKR